MLSQDKFAELTELFYHHPQFGSGIFQQLVAEKYHDGFNFGDIQVYVWHGPTKTIKRNGVKVTYCVKYEL